MRKPTFLIAARSYIILKGLDFLLKEIEDIEIKWVIADSNNLLSKIINEEPDFVILFSDLITSKNRNEFQKYFPDIVKTRLICLCQSSETGNLEKIYSDYIDLNEDKITIIRKLNRIIDIYLPKKSVPSKSPEISEREKNILRNVALGFTNKEIGEKLFISTHTVITHRKNITHKLGIKTISGLTVYAILNNIIAVEEISK